MNLLAILNLFSTIFMTFLFWSQYKSLKNFTLLYSIPPIIFSGILPLFLLDEISYVIYYDHNLLISESRSELINLITINILFILFFYVGFNLKIIKLNRFFLYFYDNLEIKLSKDKYYLSTDLLLLFSILFIVIIFYLIDFIPLFETNPGLSKFGTGDLYEKYNIFYRTLFSLITFFSVIHLSKLFQKNLNLSDILIIIAVMVVLILSFKRGFFGNYLFFIIFLFSLYKDKKLFFITTWFIFLTGFVLLIFVNPIYEYFFKNVEITLFRISMSYPDFLDQVSFYLKYELFLNKDIVYKFFVNNFFPIEPMYNFSNFTKLIIFNELNVPHGGLRLHNGMWGYVLASFPGVILFSLINGYLLKSFICIQKYLVINKNYFMLSILFSLTPFVYFPFIPVDYLFSSLIMLLFFFFCFKFQK